jgi:HEAT repeat protein
MKRTGLRFAVTITVVLLFVGAGGSRVGGHLEQVGQFEHAMDLVDRLASSSAAEREGAREELLALDEEAVPFLIPALESDSAIQRWEAINLLGALGDFRATDAVLQLAMTDPDLHVRWRANWAITRLDNGTVIPHLLTALAGNDLFVSWNAAVTLSLFGRLEAVPLLHKGLETTGWKQWEAVNALGRVFGAETATRLAPLLRDGTEAIRKEVVLSLGRIGGEITLDLLLEVLRCDPSSEVRWRAAMMIGSIGDVRVVPPLREVMKTEVDPVVLQYVQTAITRLES